jgi:hypothetical protein
MKSLRQALAAAVLLAAAPLANAALYNFSCVTNNNPGNCAAIGGQISVNITNPSGNSVLFAFSNAGPLASSIANVYWQSTQLVYGSPVIVGSGAGVSFATGGAPASPPGVGSFTTNFRVSADSPAPSNGVNPGESLSVTLALDSGVTFGNYLTSLGNGTASLAMHVISIGQAANSESLVLVPPTTVIPVPAALPLMLSGLIGLGWLARRRQS